MLVRCLLGPSLYVFVVSGFIRSRRLWKKCECRPLGSNLLITDIRYGRCVEHEWASVHKV